MLVVQLLLPRFLVMEVVLFIHFMHNGQACGSVKRGQKVQDFILDKEEAPQKEEETCFVPLGNGTLDFEPLFLNKGLFLMPVILHGSSVIPIKGQATISCPSARLSNIGDGSSNVIDVICSHSNIKTKDDDQTTIQYKDLSCSRSIRETVQEDHEGQHCGPEGQSGKIVHIGWKIDSFIPQITVCHDKGRDHTYYTNHTVLGPHLEAKASDPKRPNFKEGGGGFYSKSSAETAYKQSSQAKILSRLKRPSFFAKGHLSPDADFVPQEWQDATYYFMNAAPQWQPFNNGNWKQMEASIRNLASASKLNLLVQTGTFEGLQMDENNTLYLGRNDAIPVPLYLWKLVSHEDKAMAFVTVNNPMVGNEDMANFNICPDDDPDLCEDHGWLFPTRKKANKGLLYCCSYKSLKKVIPWAMNLGSRIGLLDMIPS